MDYWNNYVHLEWTKERTLRRRAKRLARQGKSIQESPVEEPQPHIEQPVEEPMVSESITVEVTIHNKTTRVVFSAPGLNGAIHPNQDVRQLFLDLLRKNFGAKIHAVS